MGSFHFVTFWQSGNRRGPMPGRSTYLKMPHSPPREFTFGILKVWNFEFRIWEIWGF